MGKYDINVKRLALLLLPTFWRKPGFAALAYAAVSPLQWLHTQFVLWKRDAEYRVQKNGQVCHLRAVLNDMFDPPPYHDHGQCRERRIYHPAPPGHRPKRSVPGPRFRPGRDTEPPRLWRRERLRLLGESARRVVRQGRPRPSDRCCEHLQIGIKTIFDKLHLKQ